MVVRIVSDSVTLKCSELESPYDQSDPVRIRSDYYMLSETVPINAFLNKFNSCHNYGLEMF